MLGLVHVLARERYGIDVTGQLHVKDHAVAVTEYHLAGHEVELPHAAKTLVVKGSDLGPIGLKAFVPFTQRFGVVKPKHLDISHPQPLLFNGSKHLGECRRVGARKDIFAKPRAGRAGRASLADGMNDGNTIISQEIADFAE